ncbi:unnamed protein product [Linum tenue]|uniref:Uncharacterized protein n=1 Tax=Linum tenue TaxID=586396 RepID=A0AAV0QAE7_9ROSI|nr:unnamed protein product [Linum tenue]
MIPTVKSYPKKYETQPTNLRMIQRLDCPKSSFSQAVLLLDGNWQHPLCFLLLLPLPLLDTLFFLAFTLCF